MDTRTIVVLEGDERAGAAEEALRVLAPDVIGLDARAARFDLSLEGRRATQNQVVHEAAAAIREHGLGLKAATITPGGPRRHRLAEPDPPRGDRRQGDRPHRPAHPRRRPVRRRPRADLGRADGGRRRLRREGVARRRGRRRGRVPHGAHRAAHLPRRRRVRVPARRSAPARRSSAARSTRSARPTRGC